MGPDPLQISRNRLAALRDLINRQGLDGLLVPRADEYQGEFVPTCAERLRWLTGFTGSAGIAIVLQDRAVILTDSRYTIQVRQETDSASYQTADSATLSAGGWLAAHVLPGAAIGYDPGLHTPAQLEKIRADLKDTRILLKAVDENLIDRIWRDQPSQPSTPVENFPVRIAGTSAREKSILLAETLSRNGLDTAFIARPDCVAWLLNIRGRDTECLPVALSRALITKEGRVEWFIHPNRVSADILQERKDFLTIYDPAELENRLLELRGRAVGLDEARAPARFQDLLQKAGARIKNFKDPCIEPRALKTPAEQKAIKAAHIVDGLAMVRFLSWFSHEASKGSLSEITAAEKLEECRARHSAYRGPSFPTIAGFGSNGAIVHYRASEKTNRTIQSPGLLLLDSGGQYAGGENEYGTTDITRTLSVGEISDDIKKAFTLVLKGHIAVAATRFKAGTTGAEIDTLARLPLRTEGLDYGHGTGHGVGCYLDVHEESVSLSPRGKDPIKPGMLLSNEPGYYKEGAYGIRIENLILARETASDMIEFETVSLCPIDRAPILKSLLSVEEREWLDSYHAKIYQELSPQLEETARAWLYEQTRPL
ncbi:MAG: aminopeptidase P family protein [Alphaproteobacteria bacterium]|nr:aminopeptidase P family protein [Alphaproteobacteria bacterium]